MTSASAPTGGPESRDQPLEGGRYVLERLIARSPGSDVYLGRDRRLGRAVAIKRARDGAGDDRLEREAAVLAGLSHDRVVRLLDVARVEGATCLILEHAGAANLESIVRAHGRTPAARALAWTGDVLEALEYLHGCGLAHLDVKPSNLVLARGGRVTLVDFGLARGLGDGAPVEAGTPRYRAHGVRTIATIADDLYAVGGTLEVLLGAPPRPGVGRLVDRLCGRGGEPPYASASAVRADLDRCVRDEGGHA
ncbi:MAG: serine/threonine protein kinase [Dehalococcoidia bacterium]|nr:serine/threonine protein kinase [Dehalococcoidia bacterium]